MTDAPQLDETPPEPARVVNTWAAEIIGTSARGDVVKIQVTFPDEPNSDREMRMRAMVQSIMRQTHGVWIDSLGAIKYRKWPLGG